MVNLKATIRGNITQCILSFVILLLILAAFVFVGDMAPFFAIALSIFSIIAVGSIILNLLEMRRAKEAISRIAESLNAPQCKVTVQIKKVTLLTRPAPKYDEYLICALLQGPEKGKYIYPFPREIDGSAPIRKSLQQKLTAKPLTLTCLGSTGVVSSIEGFSLNEYPSTSYRPTIFRRKHK